MSFRATRAEKKKILRRIEITARSAAVLRLRGNIVQAQYYDRKVDALVRMAERQKFGGAASLAEERGRARGGAIHRKTGLYRARGYSQHRPRVALAEERSMSKRKRDHPPIEQGETLLHYMRRIGIVREGESMADALERSRLAEKARLRKKWHPEKSQHRTDVSPHSVRGMGSRGARGYSQHRPRVRTSVTPTRARVLRQALTEGRPVSNRAKGKLEVHEFLANAPERFFAYYKYKGGARVGEAITNWMGDRLGTIVHRGKETRPFGGRACAIRVKAINGLLYAGRCNLSSGTYCTLKRVKGRTR